MNQEIKSCQNCKQNFTIEPEDFNFYKKIDVPAPTWCPDCRLMRRLTFLNHRTLYKRMCNLCSRSIVSCHDADVPFPVYCPECYWSDKWDAKSYGRDYNFSVPFFEQFRKLSWSVPHLSLVGIHWINSEYNNFAGNLRNCYLLFNSDHDENCLYGSEVEISKECTDNTMIDSCELCYEGVNLIKCFNSSFSRDCEGCQNVWFSKNCVNCNDCIGCINLRNQKYCIYNVAYEKDEYFKLRDSMNLCSRQGIKEAKTQAEKFFLSFPNKYIHGRNNVNVSGDYINHSKNVLNTYVALESENCRYCMWLISKPVKDCYDYTQFGENAERIYEAVVCGRGVSDLKFCSSCVDSTSFIQYSQCCYGASNLFGCSSMQRGNSYCILNKQYSKEEYNELVSKIVQQMKDMPYTDKRGRVYSYGEFFPPELSVFGYNETLAQEYFPISKDEAINKGLNWKETNTKDYKPTMSGDQIPDHVSEIPDSITNEVIACSHNGQCTHQCSTAFRIIPKELEFYRRQGLPLPDLCPNCRSARRISARNPNKLWHRHCMKVGCTNEFETSYAPDRPETVYCEQCYQSEVI